MSLTICSEKPNSNGKVFSKYINKWMIIDKESIEGHHRIYFICNQEIPVYGFNIQTKDEPSFITCQIYIGDIVIVCKPMNEIELIHGLNESYKGKKKIITFIGSPMNAEHPHNQEIIEIKFLVDRDITKTFFVERVEFNIPAPYVKDNNIKENINQPTRIDSIQIPTDSHLGDSTNDICDTQLPNQLKEQSQE